jgi:hypothetical protein
LDDRQSITEESIPLKWKIKSIPRAPPAETPAAAEAEKPQEEGTPPPPAEEAKPPPDEQKQGDDGKAETPAAPPVMPYVYPGGDSVPEATSRRRMI